jgi:Arc/MetJ-type ribon-helix-helix transcriptional regulator
VYKISKKPISATIEDDLIKWVNEQIKDTTKYRNKSHLIEIALTKLRREQKQS